MPFPDAMDPQEPADRFTQEQDAFFERADEAHFAWQTEGPYFSGTEAALLEAVARTGRLLEIGCGEGGNLFHLRDRATQPAGIDRSHDKLRFARGRLPRAWLVRADATALPMREGAFDALLIRDLLHHLPDRGLALREARRVLKPDATITVIEPNGKSPLVWLQGALVAEERLAWRSTGRRLLDDLLAAGFSDPTLAARQAMPVHRVALHYRYGRPALGHSGGMRRLFDGVEAMAQRLLPKAAWLYLIAHARCTPAP